MKPTALRRIITAILDYSAFPFFMISAYYVVIALQKHGVPNLLVTPIVVGPFTGLVALAERLRPDRIAHKPLDQPILREAAHFIFNFEFGYGLSLIITSLLERWLRMFIPASIWPTQWPLGWQLLLTTVLYESTSYWQHRLIHRVPLFWRFHALHHSGARLNFVRAVRFHFVDIGSAGVISYLPLAIVGTPDGVVTLLAVLLSVIGVLQHANLRMRTPWWLDRLLCTPAVHRHHHSSVVSESDSNFGNTVMIWDILFRSYGAPRPVGPVEMGIIEDPVPRDFWGQVFGPFRKAA